MDLTKVKDALLTIPELKTVEMADDMIDVGFSVETSKMPAVYYHAWEKRALGRGSFKNKKPDREQSFALRIYVDQSQQDAICTLIENALTGIKMHDLVLSGVELVGGQAIDVKKDKVCWREIYSFKTTA